MRLHVLQHVPFEGLGHIDSWIRRRGHRLTLSRLYEGAKLPDPEAFDRLVILGGPMNIHEEAAYPWLVEEKALIRAALAAGKSAVGICLGAQLLADGLGSRVYAGSHREIGWFPVRLTAAGQRTALTEGLPAVTTVFHWHGDTFDLPPGAVHLFESEACANQAFLLDNRILGLQFHLESTPETVQQLLTHCRDELIPGPFIQGVAQIADTVPERFARINNLLETLLDRLP
ncbi:type 1 glutamine amidotransferase [uncultured Desulfobulbus sp.]|uniref:type 1 glutamine amidotransferase n=1 Tax=uncultured Desulfobulbus sp. TaxID=239745 RepID=UPI00261D9E18|nr:type 1 glutamine amidotransferase [uncultured Desulfobulbus sp.]